MNLGTYGNGWDDVNELKEIEDLNEQIGKSINSLVN